MGWGLRKVVYQEAQHLEAGLEIAPRWNIQKSSSEEKDKCSNVSELEVEEHTGWSGVAMGIWEDSEVYVSTLQFCQRLKLILKWIVLI